MIAPVTVTTCCYGERYEKFLPAWTDSVLALDPAPAHVLVVSDRRQDVPFDQIISPRHGNYPAAHYLNLAAAASTTDHVASFDVDDVALPDALAGTDYDVDVYVWGLERSDRLVHVPPPRRADEVLTLGYNPFNHGGVHTVDIWHRAGGYRDIGYADWGFFVDCARAGATFATSGRVNYRYLWQPEDSMMGPLSADHDRHAADVYDPTVGRLL